MFNIQEDLQGRQRDQQIEILLISGPTFGDTAAVATRLGVPEGDVIMVADWLAAKNPYLAKAWK